MSQRPPPTRSPPLICPVFPGLSLPPSDAVYFYSPQSKGLHLRRPSSRADIQRPCGPGAFRESRLSLLPIFYWMLAGPLCKSRSLKSRESERLSRRPKSTRDKKNLFFRRKSSSLRNLVRSQPRKNAQGGQGRRKPRFMNDRTW